VALPTYVGSGALAANAAAVTPVYHASTAVDDIVLLVVETENQVISLSDAQGFVEVPDSPQFAGTAATDPANRIAVFWKRITTAGGGTAPTVADSGNHQTAALHAFRGCIATGDPWDVTAGGNDGGANDTTGVIPGDTTTVADCLVVLICGSSRNLTSTTTFSDWTNADLANLTERFDATDTVGLGGGHGMATGEKASAGAYADTTVTLAATSFKGALSIALKPPAGAGAQTVSPGLIDQAGQLFAPQINQQVQLGLIDQPGQVFAPSLIQAVSPGMIDQAGVLFAPTVHQALALPLIDQSGQVFSPSVNQAAAQTVELELIDRTGAVFGVTITGDPPAGRLYGMRRRKRRMHTYPKD
jgi:hypothetical protein